MVFNKWKKRAYEQKERVERLEKELNELSIKYDEVITYASRSPIVNQILEQKRRIEDKNIIAHNVKMTGKIYERLTKDMENETTAGKYCNQPTTIFGMNIFLGGIDIEVY
jgi:archaellum component FlaC